MKIIPKFQHSGKLPTKDNKEQEREQIVINPNDKFLYYRDFADVYRDSQGRRYSVYTEDDSLPTVTSNRARRNLEKPLWEHIQKQYSRNPQGMKTIEDAVTWGGNVAGASALAVGTAPIWLPYVAPASKMIGKAGKQTLQGLDWLFNPTTYRGALLSSYTAAEGIDNFIKNPNIETGASATLGILPLSPVIGKGIKGAHNFASNTLSRDVFRPLTFPIRNTYRKYVTRVKTPFNFKSTFNDLISDYPNFKISDLQYKYKDNIKPIWLEDQFGNQLSYYGRNIPYKARFVMANNKLKQITPEIRNQVSKYRQDFQNIIGEDGVVAGSTRGISGGYINGTLNNDTEIVTTKTRYNALKEKLNFQFNRENSVGGYSGTSPFAKGKTNEVEFDFIEEGPNGFANGTLAHSIYSVLHPEKRAGIVSNVLTKDKFTQIKTDDIELPISAEELYQQFQKAPDETKDLVLLVDMLGAGVNSVTEANAMKHAERAWNVLLNQEHTSQVSNAINILGKKWFGSAYKIPSKEYHNLKFDDVQANKEFINSIINMTEKKVPDDYVDKVANNPKQMENLFNYWYQNNLVTHRQVNIPGNEFTPQQTWDALFNVTHSTGGGTGSGVGRNSTSGRMLAFREQRPYTVEGTTQALITFHPENIKNLSQFTKKFQEISNPNIIDDFSIYKGYPGNSVLTPKQELEILENAHSLDRPIVRGIDTKRGLGRYYGSYVGSNYPQDFDPILGQRPSAVSYMQSPEFGFAFSPQFPLRIYKNMDISYPNYNNDYFVNNMEPKLYDRFQQIMKTIGYSDSNGRFIYNPKQITNLKKLGFGIVDKSSAHREVLKEAQQYINKLLPGERKSIKGVKSILNSNNLDYTHPDLIKNLRTGVSILENQGYKYNNLLSRQKGFIKNTKKGLGITAASSVPIGIVGGVMYNTQQIKNKTEDLVNSVIYDQLSQESQKETSKEVVYALVRDMVHSVREFDEEYKEETIQEILKRLQKYGIKLKETSKYNKHKN